MLPTALFSFVLLCVAGGWMLWHLRAWRAAQDNADAAERLFQLRRFRRRMQASGMLAVAAVALTVGMAIPRDRYPSLFVFFWCGVMLLVVWMLLLAVGDAVSTSLHANRLRREHRIETARLKAEMDRLLRQRAVGGNGHASNGSGQHNSAGEHNGRAHTPPEE